MEADRYHRARTLFDDAMRLSRDERATYIEQVCGDDHELAAHVRRMIRYADLSTPTGALMGDEPEAQLGQRSGSGRLIDMTIGRYRVIDLLGEGGFGAVYRAQQREPVRRMVALKILKSEMPAAAGDQVIARFEAERQALALMEHPNIARVFDAGQTEAALGSRPYFVMELVTGQPITDYCNKRKLELQSRLELFIAVCQGVQHAHQKGIIHRDLKPSNILVAEIDGHAVPKIIDFGIAKATVQPLTDHTLVTQARQILGTPQYMSPEQADSDLHAIDTRSDIYSLGAVLFELLTGETPLPPDTLRQLSYNQILQLVREQPAVRPSTALRKSSQLSEADQQTRRLNAERRSVIAHLRGDLDWITLKALEKDRDQRYQSAHELAEDVRRHLEGEPVAAAPPSVRYRVGKFVRRHRVGVSAAALVGLAVIGGAIGTTVGMVRARDSARQALSVNEFMRDVLTSVEPDQDGADVGLVEVLDDASRTASERFAGHPDQEAMVREMLGQVYFKLGMFIKSAAEQKHAMELWSRKAGADDPRALGAGLEYAHALIASAQLREAEETLNGLVPRMERAYGADDLRTLRAQSLVGMLHVQRGRDEQALRVLNDLRLRVTAAGDDDKLQLRIYDALIQLLFRQRNPAARQSFDELKSLVQDQLERSIRHYGPESTRTLRPRLMLLEIIFEQGDYVNAASAGRSVLNTYRARLGECHHLMNKARQILEQALHRLGNAREAAELAVEEVECVRQTEGESSLVTLSFMCDALPYLDRAADWAKGEYYARLASAGMQQYGAGHGNVMAAPDIYLARFVSKQGRLEEAESMFQALLLRVPDDPGDVQAARLHTFYGAHLAQRGLFDEAEKQLQTAVDVRGELILSRLIVHDDDIILGFIDLYDAWGKPDKLAEYRQLHEEFRSATSRPAVE